MIKIVAKNIVIPAKKQTFIETAKELVEKSRMEEGCIAYSLHEDMNDGNILTFIEQWKDQEAIDLHNQSEHFTSIVPKLGELSVGAGEVNLYKEV